MFLFLHMNVRVWISAPVVLECALIGVLQQTGKGHLAEQSFIKLGTICTAYMDGCRRQLPSFVIPLMNGRTLGWAPFRGMCLYLPACDCAIDSSAAESETTCHPLLRRVIQGWLFLHASALILTKHRLLTVWGDMNSLLRLAQDNLARAMTFLAQANKMLIIYICKSGLDPASVSRIISLMSFNQLLIAD